MKTKKQRFKFALSIVLAIVMTLSSALFLSGCFGGDAGDTSEPEAEVKTYTVAFSVDGKETTTTVENGQTVKKPADPQKEGYEFYGWYTTANFTQAFAFDTPITEDVTVYARLVSTAVAEGEYSITFMNGEEVYKTAGTSDGVVAIPDTTPGDDFVGWWISDYDDPTKLTYEYDGRVLGQNTTLYAVYKSDAPIVTVTENGIYWTSVQGASKYVLKITDTHGYTLERNETRTYYDYGFADRDEGDYKITVTANGNTGSAYYKNKALDKVSLFSVNSSILTFNDVHADRYFLSIDCGDKEHVHDAIELGKNTYYDFLNCAMQEGGIKFTVTAEADGKVSSVGTFVYEKNLDAVSGLEVESDALVWNAVENADYYTVQVNDEDPIYVGAQTSFALTYLSGDNNYKVVAYAKGYNSSVATIDYNKTQLATPANLKISDSEISWDEVEGAKDYTVKIDDAEYVSTTPVFSTEGLSLSISTYKVSVKANSADASNSSSFTDVVNVKRKITVDDIKYENGKVSWTSVIGAKKYAVKVNDGEEIIVEGNEAEVSFDKSGINVISFASLNSRGQRSNELEKEVAVYAVKYNTDETHTLESQYYVAGDEIKLPDATKTGYTLGNWYNSLGGAQSNAAKFDQKVFDGSSNLTLYASWIPNEYTITMVSGEYGEEITDTVTVKYNENYTLPIPVATDNVKGFIGWRTQTEGGAKFTDGLGNSINVYSMTDDLTVYAQWEDVLKFTPSETQEGYAVSKTGYTSYVKEITIPATYTDPDTNETIPVVEIAADAFLLCRNIEVINIPDSIVLISTGTAFKWCYALTEVNVYESEINVKGQYNSYDGVLYYTDINSVLHLNYFPIGRTGEYHIPETIPGKDEDGDAVDLVVKGVMGSSFTQAIITKIYIPYTVTEINNRAFDNCDELISVAFDATPAGKTADALTIHPGAFYYCDNLRSMALTPRIDNFNSALINYCNALEYIDIVGESENYASVEGMITNKAKNTLIYVPYGRKGTVIIPEGITTIAANAFRTQNEAGTSYSPCQNINKVVIPSWVVSIGDYAFAAMSNLKFLEFEGTVEDNKLSIGDHAFYNTGISSLTIPENVNVIGAHAFGRCRNLLSVTINSEGDVDTGFARYAFADESGFGYESFIKNVSFGPLTGKFNLAKAFDLSLLASVTVDPANVNHITGEDGVLYNKDMDTIEFYPIARKGEYVIPDTITAIEIGFFANNNNLTSVVIGAGVQSIGTEAFKNCYSLESVTFAEGCAITSIGDKAFENCYKLSSFALPDSVSTLGSANSMLVFDGCRLLETITISEDNQYFAFDEYGVLYNKNFTTLLICFPNVTGDENNEIEIKATTSKILDKAFGNNKNVKSIKFVGNQITSFGAGLLEGNTTIENIVLPDNITVIGEGMFKGCTSLKSFTISNNITTVKAGAFENCTGLTNLTIEDGRTQPLVFEQGNPQMQGKGKGQSIPLKTTFGGTKNLQKVTLPAGVVVGGFVFYNSGIKEVEFLGDATIGAYSFYNSGLEKVTFNGAVTLSDYTLNTTSYYSATSCFENCTSLKTVILSEDCDWDMIPQNFFSGCSSLENFTLPASVTKLGANAFKNTAIKSVYFGDNFEGFYNSFTAIANASLTNDYTYTFQNCKALETVTFSENCQVTNLGNAFQGCSALQSINIPATLTKLSSSAFNGCSSLTEIVLPEGIPTIPSYAFKGSGITSFVVPNSVTTIGQEAFANCVNLTSVTFADPEHCSFTGFNSVKPFYGSSITEFTFPENGKTSFSLSTTGVFNGCETITKVTLSSAVKNIAYVLNNNSSIVDIVITDACDYVLTDGVIYGKSEETSKILYKAISPSAEYVIPDGTTTISGYAFSNLTDLKKVTIPASVQSIAAYAFSDCEGLEEVIFAAGNQISAINDYVFKNCVSLTSVALPDSVTSLGMYVFQNCENLDTLVWNNVTKIDNSTFYNTGFTEMNLGDIEGMARDASKYEFSQAFAYCTKLTKVDFTKDRNGETKNSTLDFIMASMFYNCTALEEVILSPNQTTVENSAFNGCSSLTSIDLSGVTKVTGHRNTSLSASVLANCSSLVEVTLNDDWTGMGASFFKGCSSLTHVTLPSKLTSIGNNFFEDCSALEEITLPTGVTSIGTSAFKNCVGITEVKFPSALTTIGQEAFANTGLTQVSLSANVTSLGNKVFANSKDLSMIIIDSTNSTYYDVDGTGIYARTGKLLFFAPATEGAVTLDPNKEISAYAFAGCDNITEVIIPEGINEIGANAFTDAIGLKKVTIPDTVRTISGAAFKGCISLESIEIPDSVSTMASAGDGNGDGDNKPFQGIFEGCVSLASVKLPKNIAYIPAACFRGCVSLTEIVIPDSVQNIFTSAFEDCSALETVVLSASLEGLGVLPTGGKTDPSWATGRVFKGCTSITSIVIPEKVTTAYDKTFYGWTEDQTIYFVCSEELFIGMEGWDTECNATVVYGGYVVLE